MSSSKSSKSSKSKSKEKEETTGGMKSTSSNSKSSRKKDNDNDNDPFRVLTKVQRYQLIESMLNESFPLVAILFVIFVDVILAFASIGFQIVGIVLKTDLYYIACGIWVGAFVLFAEFFTILLILRRKYNVYVCSIVFKVLSFLVTTAQIVIYSIALALSCCSSVHWVTIVLLSIGILFKLPSLVFFIVLLFKQLRYMKNFDVEQYYMNN